MHNGSFETMPLKINSHIKDKNLLETDLKDHNIEIQRIITYQHLYLNDSNEGE